MERPITVGVDGSAESLAAADWAADEAVRRRSPLLLLHVRGAAPGPHASAEVADDRQHWAERMLREAADRVASRQPHLDVSAERTPGNAAGVLLRAAGDSELMALGSRGMGRLGGFLVGSTALTVAAGSSRPVVLVRAEGQGAGSTSSGGDVVVAVDLDHECHDLFEFAFHTASMRRANLRVVYAYQLPTPYGIAPGESLAVTNSEIDSAYAERLHRTLKPWRESNPNVGLRETVEPGHAAYVVLDAAEGASLCVIGRRIRPRDIGLRMGSVDYGVLHHARCPVAVVPHA